MNDVFTLLDISEHEAQAYQHLLKEGPQTAALVAKYLSQTRTNTYMILHRLVEKGLAIENEDKSIRRYEAANPLVLRRMLKEQQHQLATIGHSFESALPELVTAYSLSQKKPGVIHMEGLDGLRTSLEDMAKSKTEVLLWGSSIADSDPATWKLLEMGSYKRRARGVATRALFQLDAVTYSHLQDFAAKGFAIRLWNEAPFLAEVAVYDDRVCITKYGPESIVTILTNATIADTFRVIFEGCWAAAKPLPD